jgi:hypothetical protein
LCYKTVDVSAYIKVVQYLTIVNQNKRKPLHFVNSGVLITVTYNVNYCFK